MSTILVMHKRLVDRKGGKCINCGETDHRSLQFVHKRGWQEFPLTGCNLFRPQESLDMEARKCDLLCNRCAKG